jgi:hypothetical protein
VFALLLFLLAVIVVSRLVGCCGVGFDQRSDTLDDFLLLLKPQGFLALLRFACAHLAVVFPGIEHHVQPRHDLLEGWQRAGRTLFAARPGFTLHAGFALKALFTPWSLRPGLALWSDRTGLAVGASLTIDASLALRACFTALALRPRLAIGAGFAGQARLALRAFRPRPSGMALRAGKPRFAAGAA